MNTTGSTFRPTRGPARRQRQGRSVIGGFTLIEMMVVAAIIAILTMIAVPSYNESVKRANRTDARGTLTLAAQYLERVRNEAGAYNPGGVAPTLPASANRSPSSGATRYTIAVTATSTTYQLTATPAGSMVGDICGNLGLDQSGLRTYSGSGGTDDRCLNR